MKYCCIFREIRYLWNCERKMQREEIGKKKRGIQDIDCGWEETIILLVKLGQGNRN